MLRVFSNGFQMQIISYCLLPVVRLFGCCPNNEWKHSLFIAHLHTLQCCCAFFCALCYRTQQQFNLLYLIKAVFSPCRLQVLNGWYPSLFMTSLLFHQRKCFCCIWNDKMNRTAIHRNIFHSICSDAFGKRMSGTLHR